MPRARARSFSYLLPAVAAIALIAALALAVSPQSASPASAAPCAPSLPHLSGTTLETIISGSISRQYYLRIPASYDGVTTMPVVFIFHGRNWTSFQASQLPLFTRFDVKANAEGIILVMPLGVNGPGGGSWFNSLQDPGYPDDVLFTSDMIDDLETDLCVDPLRIFSTGPSNGGLMSVRLACSLSARIAAIAPVVGVYYPPVSTTLTPSENCPDTRPIPLIAFHGTVDNYVPFYGGTNGAGLTGWRDIEAAVMPDWAAHNNCAVPVPGTSFPVPGVRLVTYLGCDEPALLYIVEDVDGPGPLTEGMGHHWPDSIIDPVAVPPNAPFGLNTHLLHATDLIWDFFEAHPMAEPTPTPSPTPSPSPTPAPFGVGGVVEIVSTGGTSGGGSGMSFALAVAGIGALLVAGVAGMRLARRHR